VSALWERRPAAARWDYVLLRDLSHLSALDAPGNADAGADGKAWIHVRPLIRGCWLCIVAGYSWDGATLAPDLRGVVAASAVHDVVYQFAEDLGRRWGWSTRRVLAWGDRLFEERMRQDRAAPWVRRLYYAGVRVAGYPYHQAARLVRGEAVRW